MCLDSFQRRSDEEVDIMAMEMARQFTEEEVDAFGREGEVAQQALA
jgi:hypothetical protein